MNKGKNDYHLYINGQAVPVNEEVYRAYKHFERKEEYFTYDLKAEKFSRKTASFLPRTPMNVCWRQTSSL